MALVSAVGDVLSTVISWIWRVKNQVLNPVSHFGPLIPLFWLGVSISAILFGIKIIRSFTWGK